jgi:hypothetical protein
VASPATNERERLDTPVIGWRVREVEGSGEPIDDEPTLKTAMFARLLAQSIPDDLPSAPDLPPCLVPDSPPSGVRAIQARQSESTSALRPFSPSVTDLLLIPLPADVLPTRRFNVPAAPIPTADEVLERLEEEDLEEADLEEPLERSGSAPIPLIVRAPALVAAHVLPRRAAYSRTTAWGILALVAVLLLWFTMAQARRFREVSTKLARAEATLNLPAKASKPALASVAKVSSAVSAVVSPRSPKRMAVAKTAPAPKPRPKPRGVIIRTLPF